MPKGIPENHPSIGKSLREPVRGPSWPEPKYHGGTRLIGKGFMWLWGGILAIWVAYSRLFFICPDFNDPDAAKFAFGIAERLRGVTYSDGLFYQFSKHVGYYWLMELLARISHVEVAGLQHFMAASNAWFMIGILILNAVIAYMIWGGRVALVSSTLLSISPMMWITGEYPNPVVPALFFFMLAVFIMVLSYRVKGGRWWLAASGLMFAFAILVRVDMVLGMLVPICYALFVDKRGMRRAMILYGITALVLIIVWFGILRLSIFEIAHVGPHQPDYPRSLTLNWWGMGPFLFVFAFAGFVYRFITDRRPLPFIFFWIVAFNTFYTGHVYSGRYFIPYYPVVAWLAAFSIIALYGWLSRLVKYNVRLRIAFMLLLALGASTMLTTSIIKEGDGSLRFAYGEYKTYQTNHGLEPDGAVWFYMKEFRKGEGLEFDWYESAAEHITYPYIRQCLRDGQGYTCFVGGDSAFFINLQFIASRRYHIESVDGSKIIFAEGPLEFATWYVEKNEEFLDDPKFKEEGVFYTFGEDIIPTLLNQASVQVFNDDNIYFSMIYYYDYPGFWGYQCQLTKSRSDGFIDVRQELIRFFNSDLLLFQEFFNCVPNIEIQDCPIKQTYSPEFLDNKQWLAVIINRTCPHSDLKIVISNQSSLDFEELNDVIWLATDIDDPDQSQWDIALINPKYITDEKNAIGISTANFSGLLDCYYTQRLYPDSQYRDQVARPLGLEFADLECER